MRIVPDAVLAILWVSLFWLIVLGVPLSLPMVSLTSLLLLGGRLGTWSGAAVLGVSLAAEVASGIVDGAFVRGRGWDLLALSTGLVTDGLLLGPVLGPLAWDLSMGDEGHTLLRDARRLGALFGLGRLIRGGAACGLAFWIFRFALAPS